MVRQSHDVSADGIHKKKSGSLILAGKEEALHLHRKFTLHVLHSTGVEGVGCFKSQDGKYGNGGIERCGTIYYTHCKSIPLAVVPDRHNKNSIVNRHKNTAHLSEGDEECGCYFSEL